MVNALLRQLARTVAPKIVPMRVEAWSRFLADIEGCGYEVVDQWKCFENLLDVPCHPECTLKYFRGFYLRRAG